ncbi:MAG: glycosyltransferase family 2 protein [bacterium]
MLSIILISYNTAELTIKALNSIYNETKTTAFNIIVVDNASNDDSVTQIKKHFPNITLIESSANLGFAKGVNLAAKYVETDYMLLINPDTQVLDNAIDTLVAFAQENPSHGIWGGITLNNDHSINSHNAWHDEHPRDLFFSAIGFSKLFAKSCFFNRHNYGCWQRNSIKTVDIIQGSFFLTTHKLWQTLDGFDDCFFMYGEEADYCYRARQLNYQPIITPNAKIIHHGGASERNISGKMIRLLTGKVTLINKHHQKSSKQCLMKQLLVFHVFNKMLIYHFAILFSPSKKVIAKEWQTVFQQRKKWLKGYQRTEDC